jgi:hydroxyacylglutathione hydrolase
MKIQIIKCLKDNYSYIIIDETNNNACVVDPSEAKPIIDFVENNNINLKYILNTHHHYDHVGGNLELKKSIIQTWLDLVVIKIVFQKLIL